MISLIPWSLGESSRLTGGILAVNARGILAVNARAISENQSLHQRSMHKGAIWSM
jgi:hypothetical protein